jgi:glyoxylase-like metal-dependent hydrolase (beta-lactamase superfamily II)
MQPIRIPLGVSTTYLLPCRDGYLQVDTGYDRDYPLYRKRLARLGISPSQVKYLFLTHHHDDHAGFLNELCRDSDPVIIANKIARHLLTTGRNDVTHGGGYVNRLIKFLAGLKMRLDPHWTLAFPPFFLRKKDIIVDEDDSNILPEIGINGRILYTPGHCVDHQVIVLDGGETFCGDAAANFLLWAGTKYFPVFMTDMDEAFRSWRRMLAAGSKKIYPTHGKSFDAKKLRQNINKVRTMDLVGLS